MDVNNSEYILLQSDKGQRLGILALAMARATSD